jgi:hypothetical protein
MKQDTTTNFQIPSEDIILMVNIISAVSKRGAFEPDEFQIVGSLFERLKALVLPKGEHVEDKDQLELDFNNKEQQ